MGSQLSLATKGRMPPPAAGVISPLLAASPVHLTSSPQQQGHGALPGPCRIYAFSDVWVALHWPRGTSKRGSSRASETGYGSTNSSALWLSRFMRKVTIHQYSRVRTSIGVVTLSSQIGAPGDTAVFGVSFPSKVWHGK